MGPEEWKAELAWDSLAMGTYLGTFTFQGTGANAEVQCSVARVDIISACRVKLTTQLYTA